MNLYRVKDVLKLIRNGTITYPLISEVELTGSQISRLIPFATELNPEMIFNDMRSTIFKIKRKPMNNNNFKFNPCYSIKDNGNVSLALIYQDIPMSKAYNSTNANLVGTDSKRLGISAFKIWYEDDSILKTMISNAIVEAKNRNIDLKDENGILKLRWLLRQQIISMRLYPSQFRPQWMISIVMELSKRYNFLVSNILDPFAGWGDRLLASMRMKIPYTGIDVNSTLLPGYNRMKNDHADDKSKYKIIIGNSLEVLDDDLGMFDLVLTSPPYFDIEIYEDNNPKQSSKLFSTMESWENEFYFPVLDKCWNNLKRNGFMVIQINDHNRSGLEFLIEEKTKNRYDPESKYPNYYVISRNGFANRWLVFRKEY